MRPTLDTFRNRASSVLSINRRTGRTLRSTENTSSPAPNRLIMVRNMPLLLPLRKCWLVAKSESPMIASLLTGERIWAMASRSTGRSTSAAKAWGPAASTSGSYAGSEAPRRERSIQLCAVVKAIGASSTPSGTSAAGTIAATPGK